MTVIQNDSATKLISPRELAARLAQAPAVDLIDVRTPGEFAAVHACSARLFPLDRLDPQAILQSRQGAADEPLYIICKSGARAAKACERFAAAGFASAICVEGGTSAWEQAGLPVVRGRGVISLERQVRIAAGLLVLLGVVGGALLGRWFFAISGAVGAGLVFAGVTDTCAMGMLLSRMPWNQRSCVSSACGK